MFEALSRQFNTADIEFFSLDLNRDELPVPIDVEKVPTLLLFRSPLYNTRDAPFYVRYDGLNNEKAIVQFLCRSRTSKGTGGAEAGICRGLEKTELEPVIPPKDEL
jgi:hypothetical protein